MAEVQTKLTGNCTSLSGYGAVVIGGMISASKRGVVVSFLYDGKSRVVEVHAIGLSTKDGRPVLRGYQVGGEASRPLPQWTLFSIDKITEGSFVVLGNVLSGAPREGYAMGDKQMSTILAQLVL